MAKKQAVKPDQTSTAESTRKVAEKLGGGEARLYNVRKHALPDLVEPPPEKLLAEHAWFLAHFPSRRWVVVKDGRAEGLRLLKRLEAGRDECGLLPPVKPSRARARVCVKKPGPEGETGPKDPPPPANQIGYTLVPDGSDFDQAMQYVFPVARLTQHFERLLTATEPIYDREGKELGEKPAFGVQFQTLKALTEWHQGRPTEKPKKTNARPVLTLEELREKMIKSDQYRAAIIEMAKDCEAEAVVRAAKAKVPPPLKKPA